MYLINKPQFFCVSPPILWHRSERYRVDGNIADVLPANCKTVIIIYVYCVLLMSLYAFISLGEDYVLHVGRRLYEALLVWL